MKAYVFASLGAVVLLGAGCMNAESLSNIENGPTYAALSCGTGFEEFTGSRYNIEFCAPVDNDDDELITVKEENDGVILSTEDGQIMRIAVVEIDEKKSREEIVREYARDVEGGVTCNAVNVTDYMDDNRERYILAGELNGEQGLDATTACTFDEAEGGEALVNENAMRSGEFRFYDREPGLMYIISGGAEWEIGTKIDAFENTIQPQM